MACFAAFLVPDRHGRLLVTVLGRFSLYAEANDDRTKWIKALRESHVQDKSLFKDRPSNFQHVAKVEIASGKFNVRPPISDQRPKPARRPLDRPTAGTTRNSAAERSIGYRSVHARPSL